MSAAASPLPALLDAINLALYEARTVDDAYAAAKADELGGKAQIDAASGEAALAYDELRTHDLIGMLSVAGVLDKDGHAQVRSFADIGCGAGRLLASAACLGFQRVVGCDVLPSLVEEVGAAARALPRLDASRVLCGASGIDDAAAGPLTSLLAAGGAAEWVTHCGSALSWTEWASADVVFMHSLCFSSALKNGVLEIASANMRPGALLLSSCPFQEAALRRSAFELAVEYEPATLLDANFWDHDPVTVYRRVDDGGAQRSSSAAAAVAEAAEATAD